MKKHNLVLLVLVLFSTQLFSQKALFKIDDKPFYTDEFLRVYNKNLDLVKDESQKDLNAYLDLYIGYKLKVEKAKKLGLQNEEKYKGELNSYRTQLAKTYLNDVKVTKQLVDEAYDRMKQEVKASHILVLIKDGALPKDTLDSYKRISDLRNRILKGEKFDEVAKKFSEDPSAKTNGGDLGYFSAFKMVYPFENEAFNTPVGGISKIFRTRFGYHILRVDDKRPNRGEVTVAHIMLLNPKDANPEKEAEVKNTIDDIYKKIQQGESFEALANQFSDDKSTSTNGGKLQRFASGQLTSQEFENVAFSLKEKGEISQPFQSQFGWHIVKLIDKFPVKSLEEVQSELENKVKKDERSILITNSLAKKLQSKYSIEKNNKLYAQVVKAVSEDFYKQSWERPTDVKSFNESLLTIDKKKKFSANDFLEFVETQQKLHIQTRPVTTLVDELYEKWFENELLKYYDDNLENEIPEFRYVMDEYRDGLLLFDLMEKEIWDKAKTDSIGLEKFYNMNKANYMWKKRFDVDIYSSTDEKIVAKAQNYIKKGKSIEYIKEKLNKDGKVNIMVKSGIYEEDYDVLPELKPTKKGTSDVVKKGEYFFVANVKEIKPETTKTIEECKGKLISDYQQYLENNWVSDLKKEFKVSVDNNVFDEVKSQVKK
ncbi:peptidylprolyl isomerase [Flavobacterium haoranii]|uniref:Peptidyl-prolyl cis-trans isomerase SurA n=1 Tax=Flavobacterium haoranii TaxID=683124 RepID=A0A1M6BL68_9FLAO|nr:peptidylprolyl isomerase [Flavobacterium haoranii]SHI49318.1 peptidyl-prolyl cis-trans isomerase SurA [Flavobacterium haoranii]